MPVRWTRMSTSLMPTSGSGTSSIHRPGSGRDFTSAFTSDGLCRAVADPVARAGAAPARPVVGVGQLAAVQRQAAAADALGEPRLEALELGDPLVDPRRPAARQARPVAAVGRAVGRQLGQLGPDLVE